ncbi:shikimate kinase [Lentibacillus halophilus]|uniref:Shikimate kinase n=1 Tax=Lentibacillus halophilus TaxID=295065 RepID=A0ABP3J6B2_9BACI
MKPIYLIGFMGSGKSTIGERLCTKLDVPLVDTDQMIVDKYGPITTIFQEHGEQIFRKYETEMLKRTGGMEQIVSTGGGMVEREENVAFMTHHGLVVHLNASMNAIASRLGEDPNRPLWGKDSSERVRLYNRRKDLYTEAADATVLTDNKSIEAIAEEIADLQA